ncbi:uncharacterized protein LOC143027944 [Oratosquilla oratoria]|uniref:uncharacterized protein LOC143027944 n=1 Tax=Oratosquilla oratoria TaxID=337810 RepID=UPI003F75B141
MVHSAVWNYFEIVSGDTAKCKLCSSNYSRKGRTTTGLRNHLKSKHHKEYKIMKREEEQTRKQEEKQNLSSITPSSTADIYDSEDEDGYKNDFRETPGITQIHTTQNAAIKSIAKSSYNGRNTLQQTGFVHEKTKRSIDAMDVHKRTKRALNVNATKSASSLDRAVSELHKITTNSDTEDQYSRFTNHVESQLRELPLTSFIILQEKIQSLITQERLATLQNPYPSPPSYSHDPSPNTSILPPSSNTSEEFPVFIEKHEL